MKKIRKEEVQKALSYVIEPDLKKDIVALGFVKEIRIDDAVRVRVMVKNPAMHSRKRMEDACVHQLKRFLGEEITYEVDVEAAPNMAAQEEPLLKGVEHVIAIASGKG
ncbi:MAG: iron-sulfur cluster assembly protein, partial [Flavobacteriales bacterium]